MLDIIVKSIKDTQSRQHSAINIINLIEPVLRNFNGKKITKRIKTAVERELVGYTFFYGKVYSWYSLDIWGNEITYENRISLNLGYGDTFNFESYVKNNQRYYLEHNRYNTLNEWLNNTSKIEELIEISNKINNLKEELKGKMENVPYPISYFFRDVI